MKYQEIKYDLFEVNEKMVKSGEEMYCLAHCISADFAMAGGIVLGFNERWDMKNQLRDFYGNVRNKFQRHGGFVIPVMVKNTQGKDFPVFNLITKLSVKQQPTYDNIERALEDMLFEMDFGHYHKVAMPMIGCGIDGKEWSEVSKIIQRVFDTSDIEVLVCKREDTVV